ncbi:MAG: helix-turn-helix domain-containing protein [Chloroflexota bacterium]
MKQLLQNEDNQILASIQAVFGNEEMLFQVAELFPVPIQVFTPDGNTIFANQAMLELWNISDASQIVGKYNLRNDPVVNERLGLHEYVERVFRGEIVRVPDVKVPLEDFSKWYQERDPEYDVQSMFVDILNFPILNQEHKITHIVSVFITNRIYSGQSHVAKAREYIETHWQDEFDMEKIAQTVNLSKYHLARLFKKHSGVTPYSYYQDVKIRKLKEALRDTSLTVAQAFAACGVEYTGSFARVFREAVGMTPTQYRKSLQ